MPKVTLHNPRKAGRLVFVEGGSVHIPPGKSADVELTDAQIETEKKAGLEVEGASKSKSLVGEKGSEVFNPEQETDEGDKFDAMNDDELREYIEAETGDKPHWNAKEETLREKARSL